MLSVMLVSIIIISSYLGFALGLINQIGQDEELSVVKGFAWRLPVLVPFELIKYFFLRALSFLIYVYSLLWTKFHCCCFTDLLCRMLK